MSCLGAVLGLWLFFMFQAYLIILAYPYFEILFLLSLLSNFFLPSERIGCQRKVTVFSLGCVCFPILDSSDLLLTSALQSCSIWAHLMWSKPSNPFSTAGCLVGDRVLSFRKRCLKNALITVENICFVPHIAINWIRCSLIHSHTKSSECSISQIRGKGQPLSPRGVIFIEERGTAQISLYGLLRISHSAGGSMSANIARRLP